MKHLYTLILVLASLIIQAQEADRFTGTDNDRPRDPRMDQMDVVPNEVLVKFKDDVQVNGGTLLKSAGITGVDKLLQDRGIEGLEKLFPTETRLKSARVVKDPLGQDMVIPSLHNIYKIVLPQLKSTQAAPPVIFEFLRELNKLPEVEYAEPNHIFSIGDFTPEGPEMSMLEAMEQPANYNILEEAAGLIPNDPLYNSQWGIPATKIDVVWNTTTGDETQVIGILDTGVDWTHPDLAANIWANQQEIPDNGMDDDGNGYIDDIRGWDFINHDNNPMDDNSHGTHVAGIAAAVGDNGIGIAGVNWKARIMPIKVFQSSGRGDAATIAQGVTYAVTKGATVLNMSFGSYAESLTLKNALANAYATAVLVAAAGNDGTPIGPCMGCAPQFPAAFSFVMGVEANTGDGRAGFSNFDQDGPTYSQYPELFNYELKAPGTGILSCVPGGNYRQYNGSSMAAPLVAGALSIYRILKPTEHQEIMWGNLINTIEIHINLQAALNVIPKPILNIVKYNLSDTLTGGDWDWKADAGETIQLEVNVRNTWGTADSVFVGVRFQEFEDTSTATIEKSSAIIGAIGIYASLSNAKDLLQIKIQPTVAHNRDIQFVIETWQGKNRDYFKQQGITIRVEKGIELKGVLEDTLRLTPDKYWLVSNSFKIGQTGVLILLPGSYLKIDKNISNFGNIISIGNKDSLIIIEGPYTISGVSGKGTFKHTHFKNLNIPYIHSNDYLLFGSFSFEHCKFTDFMYHMSAISTMGDFVDCEFKNFYGYNSYGISSGSITKSNFTNMQPGSYGYTYNFIWGKKIEFCNFALIKRNISHLYDKENNSLFQNNILGNFNFYSSGQGISSSFPHNYWGTLDSLIIQEKIYDFWDDASRALVKYKPILIKPSPIAHACVWKVVVNEKDAQDEFHLLDPLGVGIQKFEVFFNRPMDTQFTPQISMGVREPYNQVMINENGSWSLDSLVYTVYKTLTLTANNGLNRIKVIGGKDVEGFELVPENERFNVNVQTVASASAQFQATPGLGKVDLEWNNNDLEDGLGYNMYRMEQINDSTLSAPVMINTTLITDTLYSDFAVVPNQKYFYYYKILRTSLEETDSSKVVAAVPYTASLGDANGDLSVNVLDVTSIVAYLLNQDPKPFIFDAADVNGDQQINVLDIVATVNLVLNPTKAATTVSTETVSLYMMNDTLFADAPVAIGAIQFDITGVEGISDIERLSALNGFESGFSVNGQTLRLIVYSLTGKTIPAGNRIPLLKLKKGSGITQMVMGDKNGAPLAINYITTGLWNLSDLGDGVATLGQNYPNPFDRSTIIPVMINEPVDEALIRIVNINGQQVAVLPLENPVIGENLIQWEPGNHKGLMAYILEIRRNGQQVVSGVRKMIAR